jgi:bacterioferritin-associated ferredoxin
MIVCLCKGVSDSTVRTVVREGATSLEEVGMACTAGTDCGGCRGCIEDLIDEELGAAHAASGRRLLPVVRAA